MTLNSEKQHNNKKHITVGSQWCAFFVSGKIIIQIYQAVASVLL